jgi:chromosome segregation ATPase
VESEQPRAPVASRKEAGTNPMAPVKKDAATEPPPRASSTPSSATAATNTAGAGAGERASARKALEAKVAGQVAEWQQRVEILQAKMSKLQAAVQAHKDKSETAEATSKMLEAQLGEKTALVKARDVELALAQRAARVAQDKVAALEGQLQNEAQPLIESLQKRLRAREEQAAPRGVEMIPPSRRAVEASRVEKAEQQRRLDALKSKCAFQAEELATAKQLLEQCRGALARLERERATLQARLAQRTGAAANVADGLRHLTALEQENQQLRHELQVVVPARLLELQQQQQQPPFRPGGGRGGGGGEGELRQLQQRLLTAEKENLELRFRVEEQTLELPRLRARVAELTQLTMPGLT